MQQWFWGLTTAWELPPGYPYTRHEVTISAAEQEGVLRRSLEFKSVDGRSSRRRRLEDFPFARVPVMSEAAVEQLEDLLLPHGAFIKVNLSYRGQRLAGRYYIYMCTTVVDCAAPDGEGRPWSPLRLDYTKVSAAINACRYPEGDYQLVSTAVAERLCASTLSGWMLVDAQDPPRRQRPLISGHLPLETQDPKVQQRVLNALARAGSVCGPQSDHPD